MTLDDRIKTDLEERLEGKTITSAVDLQPLHAFSTLGMPGYFTGNRDAKTVFVQLNPGLDAIDADARWDFETKHFHKENFIDDYKDSRINYGKNDRMREDPFDFKQAAFLYDWKDSGIGFPCNIDWNNKNLSPRQSISWLDAKEHVLLDKLQLELVPYASSKFDINKDLLYLLFPFVDTLLEEIFRPQEGRKYVIFGGDFDELFELYNKEKKQKIFEDLTRKENVFKINGTQMSDAEKRTRGFVIKKNNSVLSSALNYKVINICLKGKQQKALIAYTYPKKSLTNAFRIMQAYGKFCYEEFKKHLNSNP